MARRTGKEQNNAPETVINDVADIGERIRKQHQRYRDETYSRAFIAPEDGLSPVQRRSVQALRDVAGKRVNGSARVIGQLLGEYHPHGDSGSYKTMIRMAQTSALVMSPVTFVGQTGGSSGGKTVKVAMRYTEMGLSAVGREVYLPEELVPCSPACPNYDNKSMELVLLPVNLPMALMTNNRGISVGNTASYIAAGAAEFYSLAMGYLDARIKNGIHTMLPETFPTQYLQGPELGYESFTYFHGQKAISQWTAGLPVNFYSLPEIAVLKDTPGGKGFARIVIRNPVDGEALLRLFRVQTRQGKAGFSHPALADVQMYNLASSETPSVVLTMKQSDPDVSAASVLSDLLGYVATQVTSVSISNPAYYDVFRKGKPARMSMLAVLDRWFAHRFSIETAFVKTRLEEVTGEIFRLAILKVLAGDQDCRRKIVDIVGGIKASETDPGVVMQLVVNMVMNLTTGTGKKTVHVMKAILDMLRKLDIPARYTGGFVEQQEKWITAAVSVRLTNFRWSDAKQAEMDERITEFREYLKVDMDEIRRVRAMKDRIMARVGKLIPERRTQCIDMFAGDILQIGNWCWVVRRSGNPFISFAPEIEKLLKPVRFTRPKPANGGVLTFHDKTGDNIGMMKPDRMRPVFRVPKSALDRTVMIRFASPDRSKVG